MSRRDTDPAPKRAARRRPDAVYAGLLTGTLALLADRTAKEWAVLQADSGRTPALFGVLRFSFLKNEGVCLGALSGYRELVKRLSAAMAVFLTVRLLLRRRAGVVKGVADGLLIGGAWGNTLDRILRGYVVDFLQIRCKNERLSRISFNPADVWIAAGTLLGLVSELSEIVHIR